MGGFHLSWGIDYFAPQSHLGFDGGDAQHSLRIPGVSSCTVGQAETCRAIVHSITIGQAESCRAIVNRRTVGQAESCRAIVNRRTVRQAESCRAIIVNRGTV